MFSLVFLFHYLFECIVVKQIEDVQFKHSPLCQVDKAVSKQVHQSLQKLVEHTDSNFKRLLLFYLHTVSCLLVLIFFSSRVFVLRHLTSLSIS